MKTRNPYPTPIRRSPVRLFLCLLVLGLSVSLHSGCESESADEAGFQISPTYAEISLNESLTLQATGWHSYRWTLSQPSIGTLSSTTGDAVTYTAILQAGATNVITVSTIGVSTNSGEQSGLSAKAWIVHK